MPIMLNRKKWVLNLPATSRPSGRNQKTLTVPFAACHASMTSNAAIISSNGASSGGISGGNGELLFITLQDAVKRRCTPFVFLGGKFIRILRRAFYGVFLRVWRNARRRVKIQQPLFALRLMPD